MAGTGKRAKQVGGGLLLGLLILGLVGFGTDNFGGSVRSVAAVGDRDVLTDDYVRALQAEQRRVQEVTGQTLPMAQMRAAGLDEAVLRGLLAQAALEAEAEAAGISAGDARVRDLVVAEPAFQGASGAFDEEAYRFVLERSGLDPRDYEEGLRADAARELMTAAVTSGIEAPDAFSRAVLRHVAETRDVTVALVGEAALDAPVADPTPEALAAWYEEHGARFEEPLTRVVTYARLDPAALAEPAAVEEEALRRLYDARADEYLRPERRLVERLVYPDEAAARAAVGRLEAGETTFEGLVEARGLDLSDVDLGDVTAADLGPAAEGVFALSEPGVVGPLDTDLGPALFRVNAILAASETAFEAVEEELRAEIALEEAGRLAGGLMDDYDDILAGGATLEELAATSDAELGTLRVRDGDGGGLLDDPAFRAAAEAAAEGDFPQVEQAADGALFALRLDEVIAPRVPPLVEVREAAADAWRGDRTGEALAEVAAELSERLAAGEPVAGDGVTVLEEAGLRRDGVVERAPGDLAEAAFALDEGATAVVPGVPAAAVRVDRIVAPDPEGPRNALIAGAVAAQVTQGIAQDALEAFVAEVQAERGVERNAVAVEAVASQLP